MAIRIAADGQIGLARTALDLYPVNAGDHVLVFVDDAWRWNVQFAEARATHVEVRHSFSVVCVSGEEITLPGAGGAARNLRQ